MKAPNPPGVYDTFSTELSAALRAVGCDLIDRDPIRRVFDEGHPINPAVTHGLKRGGRVQYRHVPDSEEYGTPTAKLAQVYAEPNKTFTGDGWIQNRPEDSFDFLMNALREKIKGSEAGILLEGIIAEYPKELMRHIRAAFEHRRENIGVVANREDLVEIVRVKKDDGHYVLHHAKMPQEQIQALLES
jgi:hypothetical protein